MPKQTFDEMLKEFQGGGGMEAAGNVLGDTIGAFTSESKYTGGVKGKAIGGGIGTVAGSFIGMPGLGQAVGSLIGGLIGGKSDKENMIDDYEGVQRKKYNKLDLAANVNPYGTDQTMYMAEGGMGMLFGEEDPNDPTNPAKKVYKTQAEVDAANMEAKRFAKARRAVAPDYAFVAKKPGDPVVQYLGLDGKPFNPEASTPFNSYIPPQITRDDIQSNSEGLYSYPDPNTGDLIPVNSQVLQLPRFKNQGSVSAKAPTITDVNMGRVARLGKGGTGMKRKGRIKFMAEGGASEEPPTMVNIEKGEILIDPVSLNVLRKYENPNRYEAHSKNVMKEAIGNFTPIEQGQVVISKKYAKRYEKGDDLTRKSIIAEILKNQANNPEATAPRSGVPFARSGMIAGLPGDDLGPYAPLDQDAPDPLADMYQFYQQGNQQPIDVDPSVFSNTPMLPGNMQNAGGQYNWMQTGDGGDLATDVDQEQAGVAGGKPYKANRKLMIARALGFVPTAFGITNALGVDPFLRYDENTQMDNAKAYIQGMETAPNIEASKAAIRRTNAGRNQVLNNFNSPATRAEVAANNTAGLKAEGELIQNAVNTATDMRNKKRQTLASLEEAQGQGRLNQRQSLMNELRMDKANRENLIHQGLSEGVTNYQKGVMDEERLRAVNAVAEYYKIDPYSVDLLGDQGVFMERVFENLGRLKGSPLPNTGTPAKGKVTSVKSTTRDRVGNVKSSKDTKIIRN